MFRVGQTYRARCGQLVHIHAQRDGYLIGTCYGLKLQYGLDGKRVPRGGTDPFDLTDLVRVDAA